MKKLALALLLLAVPSFAQSVVDPEVPNRKVTVTLGALNATASVSMQGRQSASLRITTANLNATVDFQCSLDGGATYVTTGNGCGAWGGDQADGDVFSVFQQNFIFDGAAHTTVFALEAMSGVTNYRAIVSAYTSGTASAIITAVMAPPFHTFVSVDNAVVISGGVVASGALIDDTGPYVPSASDNNGFHMLGVRNDAGALTLTSGDRNASPLAVDSKGRIGITLLGGSDLGVDGSGHTQPVSGTFWQATQPVSGTFWQATQPVSGTFWQATQPVSGTFFQATQPVSIASMPSTPVTGTFWQATQPVSGTFFQATQPISAAALPLPTGASTAAKQPALGTAGTPSADVITVQGKAAMTPILVDGSGTPLPVNGTVAVTNANLDAALSTLATQATLALVKAKTDNIDVALSTRTKPADQQHALLDANSGVDIGKLTADQTVNLNKISGTAASVNSGTKDAGTLRVVLATDQPALTNKLLVTPDANAQVDLNKVAGTATSVNSGNADAGSQRVVVAGFGTIATGQTTCATTATSIASARAGRAAINITMVGAVDVYLGTSGVTTTTGDLLLGTKGTSRSIPSAAQIYCIVASGTVVVSFMESF